MRKRAQKRVTRYEERGNKRQVRHRWRTGRDSCAGKGLLEESRYQEEGHAQGPQTRQRSKDQGRRVEEASQGRQEGNHGFSIMLRGEFFNIFNHANFTGVVGNIASSEFGTATGTMPWGVIPVGFWCDGVVALLEAEDRLPSAIGDIGSGRRITPSLRRQ
jgi:hypothetical protein